MTDDEMRDEPFGGERVWITDRAIKPFRGKWTDFYGENGEVVVTFLTMDFHLYNKWSNENVDYLHKNCDHGDDWQERLSCSKNERVVSHDDSFVDAVKRPGAHLDGVHYDDESKVDESYTVIIADDYMSWENCADALGTLNEKFDRDFGLRVEEGQLTSGKNVEHELVDVVENGDVNG